MEEDDTVWMHLAGDYEIARGGGLRNFVTGKILIAPKRGVATTEAAAAAGEEEEEETWLPIPLADFEHYEASTRGRVRNTRNGRVLEGGEDTDGDTVHIIHNNDKHMRMRQRRLIALAFLGPPPDPSFVVTRIDKAGGNVPSNLKWVRKNDMATGLHQHYTCHSHRRVLRFDTGGNLIREYEHARAAATAVGRTRGRIHSACKQQLRVIVENSLWAYADEYYPEAPDVEWRTVTYRGKEFAVSNDGRVDTGRGYDSRGKPQNGYRWFRGAPVHRLVAFAFHPLPPGYSDEAELQVNHKDRRRDNNNHTNLEWVTASENIRHSVDYDGEEEEDNWFVRAALRHGGKWRHERVDVPKPLQEEEEA